MITLKSNLSHVFGIVQKKKVYLTVKLEWLYLLYLLVILYVWMSEISDDPQFITAVMWHFYSKCSSLLWLEFLTHLLDVQRKQTPWCHQTPSYSPGEEGKKQVPCWIPGAGLIRRCCVPWERGNSRVASTPWSAGSLGFACSNPDRGEGDEQHQVQGIV